MTLKTVNKNFLSLMDELENVLKLGVARKEIELYLFGTLICQGTSISFVSSQINSNLS